jgi:hypothetical protein
MEVTTMGFKLLTTISVKAAALWDLAQWKIPEDSHV